MIQEWKKKTLKNLARKNETKDALNLGDKKTENSENYFSDKSHFEDDATQNYWVF